MMTAQPASHASTCCSPAFYALREAATPMAYAGSASEAYHAAKLWLWIDDTGAYTTFTSWVPSTFHGHQVHCEVLSGPHPVNS